MATNYQNWKTNTACEISNSKNSYDDAGVQHNELMAKIESAGTPKMKLDQVFELVN